jgi:hypothetical protein
VYASIPTADNLLNMLTVITLPASFAASTTQVMSDMISDLSPFIYLVLGVILAAVVLEIVIGVLRK